MPGQPPALPGTLSRPDSQRIVDALNLRLHSTTQEGEETAAKFPIAAADLSSGAKELFLQLVTAAKRRENDGSVEVEFPGSANASAAAEITHGLSGVSANGYRVVATVESGTGCFAEITERGTSKFKVRAQDAFGQPAKGTKVTITWIAIG